MINISELQNHFEEYLEKGDVSLHSFRPAFYFCHDDTEALEELLDLIDTKMEIGPDTEQIRGYVWFILELREGRSSFCG